MLVYRSSILLAVWLCRQWSSKVATVSSCRHYVNLWIRALVMKQSWISTRQFQRSRYVVYVNNKFLLLYDTDMVFRKRNMICLIFIRCVAESKDLFIMWIWYCGSIDSFPCTRPIIWNRLCRIQSNAISLISNKWWSTLRRKITIIPAPTTTSLHLLLRHHSIT